MQGLSVTEIENVCGAGEMSGWTFAGAALAVGAGVIAVATAPAWGAVGAVMGIAAVGANAIAIYSA